MALKLAQDSAGIACLSSNSSFMHKAGIHIGKCSKMMCVLTAHTVKHSPLAANLHHWLILAPWYSCCILVCNHLCKPAQGLARAKVQKGPFGQEQKYGEAHTDHVTNICCAICFQQVCSKPLDWISFCRSLLLEGAVARPSAQVADELLY